MDIHELRKIENLPDIISPDEIWKLFEHLLLQSTLSDSESNLLLLKAFFELSDRQWHTYQPLPYGLLNKIDSELFSLWDRNSLESTEVLLGIVSHLGLVKTFENICSALDSRLLTSVRQEILEAIDEFGASVADPYSGLSKG
jgi:hypothetical protein